MNGQHHDMAGMFHETFFGRGLLSNTHFGFFIGIILVITIYYSAKLLKEKEMAKDRSPWRFNLFRIAVIKNFFKKNSAPVWLGSIPLVLFVLVMVAGFIEPQGRRLSIGPVVTWMVWWVCLVFIVTFAGKFFCACCPWELITSFIQRFSFTRSVKTSPTMGLKWPKILGNIYLATFLFLVFTWVELGFGVVQNPKLTAFLGIAFMGMSIAFAFLFERRAFCRYACLVGRISGLYSLFSPVELRVDSPGVCTDCRTKDCVTGTDRSLPCPTFEIPYKLDQNTYCTLCTECVRSCPHDNLVLKLRPFGTDLANVSKVKADESNLTIILLTMTLFHGLTMTGIWIRFQDFIQKVVATLTGIESFYLSYTLGMLLCLALPILMYIGFSFGAKILAGRSYSTKDLAVGFAFIFLPLSLFYHLAHNGMHFATELPILVNVLGDPFGRGWNLFGLAGHQGQALCPSKTIIFQICLLVTGYIFAQKTLTPLLARHFAKRTKRLEMFFYYSTALWIVLGTSILLIHEPMVMRMS